jgi:hypothetical protein
MAETIEEISDVLAEHGFTRPLNLKARIKNIDHRGGVVQLEFATSKGIERSRIEK